VSHIRKLDRQRKTTNEKEGSRPFKYNKGKEGATSLDMAHKQVHNIDSDGSRPLENREKNFRPPQQETESIMYDTRQDHQQNRGGYSIQGRGRG
jgi:hypothetical protein